MTLSFPFTIADSDLIGFPEEMSSTQNFRAVVTVSHHKLLEWRLSDEDVPKVLFEYCQRKAKQTIESGESPSDLTFEITTGSHPGACPFEVSRLKLPDGVTLGADVKRSMGFKR